MGYIDQIPPKLSAVKINGKRAYKLFRKNINFELKSKKVFVKNIKILIHNNKETFFEIECGKGFYIRSFARDLARELGTLGHISYLERTKVGKFIKESSILLDDLMKIGERHSEINFIHPSISMLDDILALEIEDMNDLKDLSLGRSIKVGEIKNVNNSSLIVDKNVIFLSHKGEIVSFGKLIGNLFKPNKVLI